MAISSVTSGLTSGTNTSLNNALSGTSSSSGSSTTSNLNSTLAGNNSASTIADSTSEALQQISDQIAAISATASGDVQEFEKTTQDVLYDNNATARNIGQLSLNTNRLNVISQLSAKDQVDVFSVNVATTGNTKFSALVNDPSNSNPLADSSGKVRIQIFAKGKGLVADSDSGAGEAYQNYQALKKGTFSMKSGQYIIRVTRADGVDPQAKSPYNYALQLTQGTKYTKDFTVTEQGYTEGTDDPFGITNNANSPANILADSLSDAFSNINSLPAIGTSGTSKLLGMIYSGSF
ncbi:hypothetical protein [Dongia sedimenti]|uniref:Uncharacterized protein n=1 Tax=Dongia sedimenti TaxID=3064282 RepID=A0ABU0YHF9_9PROT|nr:hypothetical protein [Rhodospirillaceae bacterium R-7]